MSVYARMTAIADRLRALLGVPGAIGLYEMCDYLDAAIRASDIQNDLIAQIKGAIGENVTGTANSVSEQSTVIGQLKGAINENVSKTTNEVSEQSDLIARIKAALAEKGYANQ